MGQAKRRGTYEHRVEQSQLAQEIIEKAILDVRVRHLILHQKFNGDKKAFANDIVRRVLERKNNASLDQPPKIPDNSCD